MQNSYPHLDALAKLTHAERDQLLKPSTPTASAPKAPWMGRKEFMAENQELKQIVAELKGRATAPTAARPATMQATRPVAVATAPSGTIGNGIFKPTVAPTMTRAEWQNLSAQDKSRFFAERGKLVDPPEAAKPHRINGQLTRAGFDAMSPATKSAHCKSGAGIIA